MMMRIIRSRAKFIKCIDIYEKWLIITSDLFDLIRIEAFIKFWRVGHTDSYSITGQLNQVSNN